MKVYDPLNSQYASQLYSSIGKVLYLNSELADVHFVIESEEENERIPAHKLLLMAASDVFATLFNGTWKEKNKVIITDTSVAAFKQFLQFFYFGEVKLTLDTVDAVMNLGDKYNVTECMAVCSKFVRNNLNDDNVCQKYALAILHNQHDLKQSCETIIGLNAQLVLETNGFLSCDREVLTEILKLNWMSCTEVELFEACISWIKTIAKQEVVTKELVQTHFGDLLHQIRFGSMTIQEFGALLAKYGHIFSGTQYYEIIQLILNPKFEAQQLNAIRVGRSILDVWYDKDEIQCYRFDSGAREIVNDVVTTKFSVNAPLVLKTLYFQSFNHDGEDDEEDNEEDDEEVSANITIVEVSGSTESKNEVVKYNEEIELYKSSTNYLSPEVPILIRPGLIYEIRSELNDQAYFNRRKRPPKVELDDGITVQFHDDPDGIRGADLIYCLDFCRIDV